MNNHVLSSHNSHLSLSGQSLIGPNPLSSSSPSSLDPVWPLQQLQPSLPCRLFDIMYVTVENKVMVFGSGTRLIVTDNEVKSPKVTVYPAFTHPRNGRTIVLCQASDMFPDLVRFSWKMEREDGRLVEVPEAEREELEQREDGRVTSVIIIKNQEAKTKKYSCTVKHEVANVEDIQKIHKKEESSFTTAASAPTSPPQNHTHVSPAVHVPDELLQSMCSVNLASLVYTVMIVKSLVYCCGLSLLLLLRDNKGSPPHTWRHDQSTPHLET
ncbi:immunoglobulin lambda-like polypeptide 5 [Osmerus mordax]|uniref:immunoglobulin lambda-like polypeptide 5 n=1 Tax=Osmerus mordax TaxID=8014 RepID=UPI00350FAE15